MDGREGCPCFFIFYDVSSSYIFDRITSIYFTDYDKKQNNNDKRID